MNTKTKLKPGRKPMNAKDKKKSLHCMFKPYVIKRLEIDTLNGKSATPNQRVAQIVEMYYRNKDKEKP